MPALQSGLVSVPRANRRGSMDSYLVKPEGAGPSPGLVVIHEIFGLNDNIRGIANRFAEQGYAALAIDLFSNRNRVVCMLQIIHGMLIRPLQNGMLDDLKSTTKFLQAQPGVDAQRIGVVGFCMGGGYALQLAITDKGMKAASAFYGAVPKPLERFAEACPIQGSYPVQDFTAKGARELDAALDQQQVPHDIKLYENTRHSFFNQPGSPTEEAAAQDAWQRMLSFFATHLS